MFIKTTTSINFQDIQVNQYGYVDSLGLHKFLKIKTPHYKWIKRIIANYDFKENIHYRLIQENTVSINVLPRYMLFTGMAKEICMISRGEQARKARMYFIKCEEKLRNQENKISTQDQTLDYYLGLTEEDRAIAYFEQRKQKKELEYNYHKQQRVIEEQKPKAEAWDVVLDRNLLTNLRDTAKELKVRQNQFINFLLEEGYLYRNKRGQLRPYAEFVGRYFELKEYASRTNSHAGVQPMVTAKGREHFVTRIRTSGNLILLNQKTI